MSLTRFHIVLIAVWLVSLIATIRIFLGPGMPSTLPQTIALLALGSIPIVVLLVVFRGAPPHTIAQVLYDTDQTAGGPARLRLLKDSAKQSVRSDDDAIF